MILIQNDDQGELWDPGLVGSTTNNRDHRHFQHLSHIPGATLQWSWFWWSLMLAHYCFLHITNSIICLLFWPKLIIVRIPHLRIPHWGAILRWGILSQSVIRITHPNYYVFYALFVHDMGPGWVLWTRTVCSITIFRRKKQLKNIVFDFLTISPYLYKTANRWRMDTFTFIQKLEIVILMTPTTEKLCSCDQCNFATSKKENLKTCAKKSQRREAK